MNTVILISFLLLALVALALRFIKRRPTPSEISSGKTAWQFDGLLAAEREAEARQLFEADAFAQAEATRQRLLARAAAGDLYALNEAHERGPANLYTEVLQTLVVQADGPSQLQQIAQHIINSRTLRPGREFATLIIAQWRAATDQLSVINLLHLAALSDDAPTFERAILVAREQWRAGKLLIPAKDLAAAVESSYWLLAAARRESGSGFLLKQLIADLRRELAATPRRSA